MSHVAWSVCLCIRHTGERVNRSKCCSTMFSEAHDTSAHADKKRCVTTSRELYSTAPIIYQFRWETAPRSRWESVRRTELRAHCIRTPTTNSSRSPFSTRMLRFIERSSQHTAMTILRIRAVSTVICNDFLPNWLKVVSSCLLQYKPVCITNYAVKCQNKVTSLLVVLV